MSQQALLTVVWVWQVERRRKLGLPPEEPAAAKPSAPPVEEKKVFPVPYSMKFFFLLRCFLF